MYRARTRLDSHHRIGGGQAIIVVGMKIECESGIAATHIADAFEYFLGTHYTQRIRQHHVHHLGFCECFGNSVDIITAVPITVRPIFQIDIDQKLLRLGIVDCPLDISDVFIKRLPELLPAVFFASLGKQVEHAATSTDQPIHASLVICKSKHFNPLEAVIVSCPFVNLSHRLFFTMGHTCRRDLYPIYL